jgi:uncharacterized Ntn-hydrolase superfamily protein
MTFNKLAHTYSIVARDPATGQMGVAVQSHWFSVGSLVSWAEAGVGAIATQSFINTSFGPRGLELLKSGQSAGQVVEQLIASDEGRELRQLAVLDAQGGVTTYTGQRCVPEAGHYTGDTFSVQANLMLNNRVWPAMAQAFENSRGPLAERMVTALTAGQAQGGDIRGQQSAALLVVRGQSTGQVWEDRLIDLRVEDHLEPVTELERLLRVFRAYEQMNKGDVCLEKNDVAGALAAYRSAEKIYPDNPEVRYWHAMSLANAGQIDQALPVFKAIFAQNPDWRIATERFYQAGLLSLSPAALDQILSL